MKRISFLIVLLSIFVTLSLPSFASTAWSPQEYEMPRTVIDTETAAHALSGVNLSLGAIADTGLILIGVVVSVSLIANVFRLIIGKVESARGSLGGNTRNAKSSESIVRERNIMSGKNLGRK